MSCGGVVEYRDLGVVPYGECWELQRTLFEEVTAAKGDDSNSAGKILMVEHPAVYTLGKSGKQSNMLISEQMLGSIGAQFYHIDRGGDITFHGEGQLVCYPILDLERLGIGLKQYIEILEEAVIITVKQWGIDSQRIEGASGVWIGVNSPTPRKICAIGVRASRYVTMHGLALNVSTDLKYFSYINPCGFSQRGVTSMEVETQHEIAMSEVKEVLLSNLIKLINVKIYKK